MIGTLLSACLAAATMWPCLSQEFTGGQQQTPTFDRPVPVTGYLHEMRYLDTDGDRKIDAKELAAVFHSFYRDCRVVAPEEPGRTQARLMLMRAARLTLARALALLGVSAPERM